MKDKLDIRIGNAKDAARDFVEAWHRAERDESEETTDTRLYFENLETLLKALTPRRWTLLRTLRREGPMSVRALAQILSRDYKNVHGDVRELERVGLLSRTEEEHVMVPWETIVAEVKLAA